MFDLVMIFGQSQASCATFHGCYHTKYNNISSMMMIATDKDWPNMEVETTPLDHTVHYYGQDCMGCDPVPLGNVK